MYHKEKKQMALMYHKGKKKDGSEVAHEKR